MLASTTARSSYYDRDGIAITPSRHFKLVNDWAYRKIAQDTVAGHLVTTVWFGINQAAPADIPLIFGTIAKAVNGDYDEGTQALAATEEEALANHAALLAQY